MLHTGNVLTQAALTVGAGGVLLGDVIVALATTLGAGATLAGNLLVGSLFSCVCLHEIAICVLP